MDRYLRPLSTQIQAPERVPKFGPIMGGGADPRETGWGGASGVPGPANNLGCVPATNNKHNLRRQRLNASIIDVTYNPAAETNDESTRSRSQ